MGATHPEHTDGTPAGPIPVVRMIARLNVGGATIQAITLTRLLEPRYETTLVKGVEEALEGDMFHLLRALDVKPLVISNMRREISIRDVAAIGVAVRILRRIRPLVLHTHTAKAGTVGRIAALLAGGARPPVIVHTFHGHVLEGYFSPLRSRLYALVERGLARITTRLIAVSDEVKNDLVRLGVAAEHRIEVIPLGFDLERFALPEAERDRLRLDLRSDLGIPADRKVVAFVGRLVPIKRVDRLLAVAARLSSRDDVHFLIVGDGEKRAELEASPGARALGDRLTWAGFRRDLRPVYAASDLVVLTSDNEGTPVSLIEAQASGLPVVTTEVGGARAVVDDAITGRVLPREDEAGIAAAIADFLDDPALAERVGAAGRRASLARFGIARLVRDVDNLYSRLLAERGVRSRAPALRRDAATTAMARSR